MSSLLYHYTSFESGVRIIVSQQFKFGRFDKVNDIAEIKKEFNTLLSSEEIKKEVNSYRFISLILDNHIIPGYALDNMWGYYANGGNGICLAINKDKLLKVFKRQFPNGCYGRVHYKKEYSGVLFDDSCSNDNAELFVRNNTKLLFFLKAFPWQHEREFRLIQKDSCDMHLDISDCIERVIMCMPRSEDFFSTVEFEILRNIIPENSIFWYTNRLGNRELINNLGDVVPKNVRIDI